MKKSTGVILVLIIVLLLGVIGVGGYFFIKENNGSSKEIGELKNEVAELRSNIINDSHNNNNTVVKSNTDGLTEKKYEEITDKFTNESDSLFVTNVIKNSDDTYTLQGVIYSQYTLSVNELNEIVKTGKMQLDNTEYNVKKEQNPDSYHLYDGDNHDVYTIRKDESTSNYVIIRNAQVSLTQKKTNVYKQITVSKDVKCVDAYFDSDSKTVDEQFKNYTPLTPPDSTHPTPSYTFEFKNGKCETIYVDNGI